MYFDGASNALGNGIGTVIISPEGSHTPFTGRNIRSFNADSKGKWTPNFEGPYVVNKVFSGGALILETINGEEFPRPMNVDAVKKYFA